MKDWTLDYFTERAVDWQNKAFEGRGMDPATRAFKVLEEAIELCEAVGIPYAKVLAQADRVYNENVHVGEPTQEWAGVLFCHLLTGRALGLNPGQALNDEINSAYERMPLIVEKNKKKVKLDD